jgi:hypothetical protein
MQTLKKHVQSFMNEPSRRFEFTFSGYNKYLDTGVFVILSFPHRGGR